MSQIIEPIRIVGLCIIAAVLYGIVHDQITARICVEYFTIGHPPIFNTDDPTLLGMGWGVVATWWVGLMLGVPLALVARIGRRPQLTGAQLVRPIAWLMLISAGCAFVAGIVGWLLGQSGLVFLVGRVAREVPADRHVPFLVDLWAHSASYLVGFIGGIAVMLFVWRKRSKLAAQATIETRADEPVG